MRIGVPLETRPGETRVAATAETVKKLISQGHQVIIQSGAGVGASLPDNAYEPLGPVLALQPTHLPVRLFLRFVLPRPMS